MMVDGVMLHEATLEDLLHELRGRSTASIYIQSVLPGTWRAAGQIDEKMHYMLHGPATMLLGLRTVLASMDIVEAATSALESLDIQTDVDVDGEE